MADFPVNPEWVWLLTIVPLTGGAFLLIAAIAGLIALIRGSTRAPRARSVAFRAAALALVSPAFPLIPLAFLKWGVEFDYDWVVALFWLSILFFAFGCWWLTRPARWGRLWLARIWGSGCWWLGRPARSVRQPPK